MTQSLANDMKTDRRAQSRLSPDQRRAPRAIDFVGTRFNLLTIAATAQRCEDAGQGPFRYVVTPNVDHIVRLHKQPEAYRDIWDGAWLSVCDSRILQLLAKFSGLDIAVVPGSDLTAHLFGAHIKPDTPINIIGGDNDVITSVKARYGLTNVTLHRPPMGLRSNPEAIEACADFAVANPADYTFICVGSPQGEMVAAAIAARGNAKGVGLCVGASLDFLAGKQVRAPKWMQNARLEWLYRLLQNPRRMYKRYLVEGPKIFLIWMKWRKVSKA